jgi:hypothetical protein
MLAPGSLTLLVLLAIVAMWPIRLIYKAKKRLNEERDEFEAIGRRTKDFLDNVFHGNCPQIYPKDDTKTVRSSVEYFQTGRWWWQRQSRALITINLEKVEHLALVEPFINGEFRNVYLPQRNEQRRVRVFFTTAERSEAI